MKIRHDVDATTLDKKARRLALSIVFGTAVVAGSAVPVVQHTTSALKMHHEGGAMSASGQTR
jgi:hypothetical protein